MFSQEEKDRFYDAIESLKRYKRAELVDERGRSLLRDLYTDLLPNDHILKKSLRENTTFLIGRKGTGKSTIFLRIEQELRQKSDVIPCYLDVKTIYESAQTENHNLEYLSKFLAAKTIKKYLIERSFLQSVLARIIEELKIRFDTAFEKFKEFWGETKAQNIENKLLNLKKRIENNDVLKEIELPIIKSITSKQKTFNENSQTISTKNTDALELNIAKDPSLKATLGGEEGANFGDKNSVELEESFTDIFLQVFQIKDFISEIKDLLKELKIKQLVVLLDDFSEIDDLAIRIFVDVILTPLNNWSEEFIKFKVAAYPNRVHFGKLDPGKIDTINLDFYNLYSEFDRSKMEEGAIDFTRRLIQKRINYYLNESPDVFFDVNNKTSMDDYYEVLFQTSMNVPRIIGYILSYCYQSKIIYDKKITKQDIESAAQRYYEDKIEPFFHKTTYSLISMDEKVDDLQLRELLGKFVDRMVEIKKKISTGEYTGEEYVESFPYTSHFYFSPSFENLIKTLELNFFISKYAEMDNRDSERSSIYCLNYGLTQKHNLLWGKPKGDKYRKYFIIRRFNFNPIIKEFLLVSKSIHCVNEECNQIYTQEQIPFLESVLEYKCNKCGSEIIIEPTSERIKFELGRIKESDLLSPSEMEIIMELLKADSPKIAREIAEEADLSKQFVAQKSRILDIHKNLINRVRERGEDDIYSYELTDTAKATYKEE